MIYLRLFFEFFQVGLFAIGGGLATLPFLYDMGEKTGWFTSSTIADMIAISESTPGPIGVNMATYAGFTTAGGGLSGIGGGILATLGLVTPSVVIIILVSIFLSKFRQNRIVDAAFYGLRPAVTGMIAAAGLGVLKIALLHVERFTTWERVLEVVDWKAVILFVVLFILIKKFNKHPIFYIAGAAVAGILLKMAAF